MCSIVWLARDVFALFCKNTQCSTMVQASFQQSVWTLHIVCSGSAREAASGGFSLLTIAEPVTLCLWPVQDM